MYRNRNKNPQILPQIDLEFESDLETDRIVYFVERGIWQPEELRITEIINMVKNIMIEEGNKEKRKNKLIKIN